jgi:hypothetical protein
LAQAPAEPVGRHLEPEANRTAFEFTATTPALYVEGYNVFQSRIIFFCFQNALGYPWRCNSRS